MPTDVPIPQLGESITEAVIATWLKADGDYVERDEEIVELETDKVTMPLPSPVAGVLKHGAAEGDTVEVGANVASIDESAAKPAGAPAPAAAAAAAPVNATEPAAPAPAPTPEPAPTPAAPAPSADVAASATAQAVYATALAKKLAEENHIDLTHVAPTGPGGRVREQDVLAYLQAQNGSQLNGHATNNGTAATPTGRGGRSTSTERMTKLRQTIATQLVKAQQTAAMLTTFNECDMTNVMALRSRHKDTFQETHGVKLGFMSFFAKAAVSALQKVPAVNSQITQTDKGPATLHHDYCDIAFAVGTPKGLVVPVLRNVESLSFAEIEAGLMDLAKRARDGKLGLDDMQGGTFTVSNGGVYGSMMSTPILNPPQSGILGMHNIIKRPIEHPDKPGEIALRPMMYLALSYDHRIVDGEGAVTFLKHIKECIESPERLLLDV